MSIEVIVLVCLGIGLVLGRLGIVGMFIDSLIMWYKNKYGKFTPGDGKNYMQVFKAPISCKNGGNHGI